MKNEYETQQLMNVDDGDNVSNDITRDQTKTIAFCDGENVGKCGFDLNALINYVNKSNDFDDIDFNIWFDRFKNYRLTMNHRYHKNSINSYWLLILNRSLTSVTAKRSF